MSGLIAEDRAPSLIVVENVCGTLTSHGGKDFAAICEAVRDAGYLFGALVIDASLFIPQSRPRLFIICVRDQAGVPRQCVSSWASSLWHRRIIDPFKRLPSATRERWLWWSLPMPPTRTKTFADLVEDDPDNVEWFSKGQTDDIIALMSEVNAAKLRKAQRLRHPIIGGLYRRTRQDENGEKVQRAEIRFDNVSGCLRTPAGGSSRQVIVVVQGASVKARLISSRETARLMGLPDTYILPENYNEAYHLTGDGVVVPVVRHLAANIFEPVLQCLGKRTSAAA
jgi:DNA (cytosine-5)-methyltransferase 1